MLFGAGCSPGPSSYTILTGTILSTGVLFSRRRIRASERDQIFNASVIAHDCGKRKSDPALVVVKVKPACQSMWSGNCFKELAIRVLRLFAPGVLSPCFFFTREHEKFVQFSLKPPAYGQQILIFNAWSFCPCCIKRKTAACNWKTGQLWTPNLMFTWSFIRCVVVTVVGR